MKRKKSAAKLSACVEHQKKQLVIEVIKGEGKPHIQSIILPIEPPDTIQFANYAAFLLKKDVGYVWAS